MKKLLLIAYLSFPIFLFGQDDEEEQAPQTTKHEIGINATALIKQVLSFSDNDNFPISPFVVTYKMVSKKGHAFRAGLGGFYTELDEDLDQNGTSRDTRAIETDFRLGYEKQRKLAKRWLISGGVDFAADYDLLRSVTTSSFEEVITETVQWTAGGGPAMGVQFNCTDKIALQTEIALYFKKGNQHNSFEFPSNPEFNVNNDARVTNLVFLVPTSLYFVVTLFKS